MREVASGFARKLLPSCLAKSHSPASTFAMARAAASSEQALQARAAFSLRAIPRRTNSVSEDAPAQRNDEGAKNTKLRNEFDWQPGWPRRNAQPVLPTGSERRWGETASAENLGTPLLSGAGVGGGVPCSFGERSPMCGIVGYLRKSACKDERPVGTVVLEMLRALSIR